MIAVFIDSNQLYVNQICDFSQIWSYKLIDRFVDKIESADLYEHVKIIIPSIVFAELHKQQIEQYKAKTNDIKNLTFPAWKIEQGQNAEEYKEWLKEEHEKNARLGKRGMVDFDIAEVPLDSFESVIERAIEKKAPFEGKDKQSDKGFKDVLIWETILEYKRKNPEESIIWITHDKQCKGDSLKKEYSSLFNEEITFCKSCDDFENQLNELIRSFGIDAKLLENSPIDILVNNYFSFFLFNKAHEIALANDIPLLPGHSFDIPVLNIENTSDSEYIAFVQLRVLWREIDSWDISFELFLTLEDDHADVEYRNDNRGLIIRERELLEEVEDIGLDDSQEN